MTELINTERLTLRPLLPEDAEPLQRLAGDRAIADTMTSVPHPFTLEEAARWIRAYRWPSEPEVPHRLFRELPQVDR